MLRRFIYGSCLCKVREDFPVNMTFLQKIRIDPLHGRIFLRRFQFLWLFRFFSFLCLFFFYSLPSLPGFYRFSFCLLPFSPFNKLSLFSVQQIAHRLRVGHPEELLHEINGMTSDLSAVAVPTAPPEKSHSCAVSSAIHSRNAPPPHAPGEGCPQSVLHWHAPSVPL